MKNIFLLLIVFSFVFVGCEDDENIKAELAQGRYYLEDDPNDYVKHYVYEFYQKYGTVILHNPQVQDYKYNFLNPNNIIIVPPVQEEAVIRAGFELFDELFLSFYTDDFKKKYLPFTLQLGDTITSLSGKTTYNSYCSRNLIALSNINSDISSMTDEKKKEISKEMHLNFWFTYLLMERKAIAIPASFYTSGELFYKEDIDPDKEVGSKDELIDRVRDNGFISYPGYTTSSSYRYKIYPDKGEDLYDFLYYIFYNTNSDLHLILDAYPKVNAKYEILRSAIKSQLDFDIATVNNEVQ